MVNISVFILSFLSLTLNNAAQGIEKAFLQNDPAFLYALLDADSYINVSLPDPISFSDQLSNEQAFYLFRKVRRFHYPIFPYFAYSRRAPPG